MNIKKIIKKVIGKESRIDQLQKKGLIIDKTSIITCCSPDGIDGVFPWLIEIGKNVIISTNCYILAHDASLATLCGFSKIGRVKIGDNVYLGNSVTVLPGVTIGNNVIVGAKSLITKDLKSNSVYAGSPAKYICSLDDFIEKHNLLRKESVFFEDNFMYWQKASKEEKEKMKEKLNNKCGYIKSRKITG